MAQKVILFRDRIGRFPPGLIFYPESLKRISSFAAALNGEEMKRPKYFSANIQFFLNQIISYFEGIHDTHDAAKSVYERYRAEGRPYCLYLRSFWLSGITLYTDLESNERMLGLTPNDRDFRELLTQTIRGRVNSLSFVNDYDIYPPAAQAEGAGGRDFAIPSFRVVSHNWREVVSEAVKGAKLVVLYLDGETEGVAFEVEAIRRCGMAGRTICLKHERAGKSADSFGDFREVIKVPTGHHFPQDTPEAERLRDRLEYLVDDGFEQTNEVRDLSGLQCHVLDKEIELAASQFDPEVLSGVAYEDYVPSSLANNWELLTHHFPRVVGDWRAIEETFSGGQRPGAGPLANVMYRALSTLYLAITLERYQEMATSVATVGIAHRLLTGRLDIMADCYGHAAKCAAWGGDASSAKYYGDIHVELREKAAATGES